jgi:CheY-like chemotaxis protein
MSRRILLADDSVTIQKVIELTFMDDDYEVRAVGNGDEALAMLTALQVDFVIADVHMPGASGYEVCRRSKQQRPEVPVLLLVGTFEPFDEAQARECGADSYLKKPFDSQELLGRVHELLGAAAAQPAPAGEAPAAASAEAPADAGHPAAAAGADAGAAVAAAAESHAGHEPAAGVRAVEAAASWQEFELEAEPELIPEPWHAPHAPQPPAPAAAAPGSEPFDQPFALGDLDDREISAGRDAAAGFEPAAPHAAAATPSGPAAVSDHQDFSFGEPLDDHSFLLDEEEDIAPPEPSSREQRATQAEPVSPYSGTRLGNALPQAQREATEAWHGPNAEEAAEDAEPAEHAAAVEPEATVEPEGSPEAADLHPTTAASPETGFAFAASPTSIYSPASSPSAAAVAATVAVAAGVAVAGVAASRASEAPSTADAGGPEASSTAAAFGSEAPPTADAGSSDAGAGHPAGHPEGNGQPSVAPSAVAQPLGDEDVDRIARRVVELIGDSVVRDIAWEVIPDLAEVVIKDRLRELESQIE